MFLCVLEIGMKPSVSILFSISVVALLPVAPALAQSMENMPGMNMPGMEMPPAKPPAKPAKPKLQKPKATAAPATPAAPAQTAPATMPATDETPATQTSPQVSGAEALPVMPGMDMSHGMPAQGIFGSYAMTRDASGTSWQPDLALHDGLHAMAGDWMLMGHALLTGVYDWQQGLRGDEKAFVSGMIMGSARRDLASGDTINLRAMLAPDPFMGKGGYPLLLATGETADGVTHLVDRQHPHDLFMELAGSYTHTLSDHDSVFFYAGLPGEPALGPPAFMHRMTAMDSPAAPISHHWLDSTHITFGVVTAGYVHANWKLEGSGFRGREPDQDRYDIETPKIDSVAVRISWNPSQNWALQASWADIQSPEQLEPGIDETRWSASAIYAAKLGEAGRWSLTGAFGRKELSDGRHLNAWLTEAALLPNDAWTIFARTEEVQSTELGGTSPGSVADVGEASLGIIRDFRVHEHVKLGIGALYTLDWVPGALDASYGGDPQGAMAFVRLKLG
jgi:hypothetical protein